MLRQPALCCQVHSLQRGVVASSAVTIFPRIMASQTTALSMLQHWTCAIYSLYSWVTLARVRCRLYLVGTWRLHCILCRNWRSWVRLRACFKLLRPRHSLNSFVKSTRTHVADALEDHRYFCIQSICGSSLDWIRRSKLWLRRMRKRNGESGVNAALSLPPFGRILCGGTKTGHDHVRGDAARRHGGHTSGR
jgi:hypothetical protein